MSETVGDFFSMSEFHNHLGQRGKSKLWMHFIFVWWENSISLIYCLYYTLWSAKAMVMVEARKARTWYNMPYDKFSVLSHPHRCLDMRFPLSNASKVGFSFPSAFT